MSGRLVIPAPAPGAGVDAPGCVIPRRKLTPHILQGQGKLSVIRQPNELVAALMRVMGIDQVAQIEYRKF